MTSNEKRIVSLVLGSGGARGLAHIGIIHWLEENGFRIASIAGCSIGALIGGIHAAGKLDEFEEWVRAITKLNIVSLLDLSWRKTGIVKGDRIIDTLVDLVGDSRIEDLPIPFTAVAADIKREREIWISSGRLFDAIRASISIPLLFTPFQHNGAELIDGGVLNPVPIAPVFNHGPGMIVAVNLSGPIEASGATVGRVAESGSRAPRIQDKVNRFIRSFQSAETAQSSFDWGVYDIATQAFDAMQGTIARQKLAAYPPDHTIEIARNVCGILEFDRANEMIDLGYRTAQDYFARQGRL